MVTTGYADTFNRTVSNGLGSATSGQTYTLNGVATQFSVAPTTAQIAIATAGDKFGYIDLQTQDSDITGQVAMSAVPATNLATAGFVAKLSSASNYYVGSMMVATGGQVSLRFSKVVGGGLVTISTTTVTGLTYVANTFYNLRYSCRWSQPLQTNILQLKIWAIGATEPGGWMATATEASFTNYTAGTNVGIHGRDESTVVGTITTKYQNVTSRSYSLPMPATTDPMCYDPAFAYPRQTALESLADAADAAMVTIDPLTSLAGLFPRVRISNTSLTINTAAVSIAATFGAIEYNVGTTTDLALDGTSVYLPVGIWIVMFEARFSEAASDYLTVSFTGSTSGGPIIVDMRSNAVQLNDDGVGGCVHLSQTVIVTDPTTPSRWGITFGPNNVATTYTVTYMALSAVKISDYFA